jgi:arylsulfatase A-like enzyme
MKAIVLVLRGLHLGYLGCYGNEWIDTPHLDRLAAEGVVFDRHFANCPDVAATRRTWRTGLVTPTSDQADDLLALLRNRNVNCRLITDFVHAASDEFLKGWSSVYQVKNDADADKKLDSLMEFVGDKLVDLSGRENGLVWIELADLLPPWSIPDEHLEAFFHPAPAEHDDEEIEQEEELEPLLDPSPGPLPDAADQPFRRLQSTYAAAVSHIDSFVGWLCDELRDRNLADESLLIVTTDHGQALGEHGIVGPYRPCLHDELVHIPLLMRMPASAGAGRRIAGITQSVDLYSTLLEVFGVDPPPNHGYSLLPLARAEVENVRSFAVSSMRLGEREERALRTDGWAFLLPISTPADDPFRGPQLYVKPDDRWEVNNVLQHHLELGERLEAVLKSYMAAPQRIGLETPWTADNGGPAT